MLNEFNLFVTYYHVNDSTLPYLLYTNDPQFHPWVSSSVFTISNSCHNLFNVKSLLICYRVILTLIFTFITTLPLPFYSCGLLAYFWLPFFLSTLLPMTSQLSCAFAYCLKFLSDLDLPIASLLGCRVLLEKAVLIESATNSRSFPFNQAVISAQHFFYSSLADSLLIPRSSFSKHFQLSLRFKPCSRFDPKIPFQFHLLFLPKTLCLVLFKFHILLYLSLLSSMKMPPNLHRLFSSERGPNLL